MELARIFFFNAASKCPDSCGNKTAVAPFKIMCKHSNPFFFSPLSTSDHDLARGDIFESLDMFGSEPGDASNVSMAMLYSMRSASAPDVAVPKERCFDEEEEEEEVAVCTDVNKDKSSSSSSIAKSRRLAGWTD